MEAATRARDWIDGGGEANLWKNKVRALQLQIRERFRVTIDKRRIRERISDGYFSSKMEKWVLRFRKLRTHSLPPTYVFYRKRVNVDIDETEDSTLMRMVQAIAVPVIGNVCHVFMHGLNRVQIYGAEKLQEALHRSKGKPLITVSNHVASVDDPFVIASLLPPSVLLDAQNLRWTLCASDRCFKNSATSAFFRSVKVLPVSRGDGVYQKGMDLAMSKLNKGGWVHIFPEGSRSRDGGRTMGSIKRGVGRLVMDADNIPIVIPFVHSGMQEIMPIGSKFPKIGKTVTVLIGDPIHVEDLAKAGDDKFTPRGELYEAISSRIGDRLHELKSQVDKLALEESLKTRDFAKNRERANDILHQLDWEAFGMNNYMVSEDEEGTHMNKEGKNVAKVVSMNMKDVEGLDSDFRVRVGFSYDGGIMSRVRGYMHPSDLMGFAARGLFMNYSNQNNVKGVGALKAWKRYFEASLFSQWNYR